MERIIGNKIDERKVKYLIHRGLFFGIPCLITDHELDIHRIMFRHWNGNMYDFVRKMEFGGREDVTRTEIESWYEARKEDEENFENHLLSKFFLDRDDVSWIELDEKPLGACRRTGSSSPGSRVRSKKAPFRFLYFVIQHLDNGIRGCCLLLTLFAGLLACKLVFEFFQCISVQRVVC